jgi:hypothetical protein
MHALPSALPQPGSILHGPFWTGPVRVLRAELNDGWVRLEQMNITQRIRS